MPPQAEPPAQSADAPSAPTRPVPRCRRARRWLAGAAVALVIHAAFGVLLAPRHAAARDALVAAGLEPRRLSAVLGGERAAKESGPRVYFTVR